MKHLKTYESLDTNNLKVQEVILKYGKEDAAKFLDFLLKGKYIIFKQSMFTKTGNYEYADNGGEVTRIFYIDNSGCMIARLDEDNTYLDLMINRSVVYYEKGDLDIDAAEMILTTDKYNL